MEAESQSIVLSINFIEYRDPSLLHSFSSPDAGFLVAPEDVCPGRAAQEALAAAPLYSSARARYRSVSTSLRSSSQFSFTIRLYSSSMLQLAKAKEISMDIQGNRKNSYWRRS
ncbi:hypothetical protein EK904_009258 [Melospiza melodia maxima]|nr:hypothetical protein EK904_009258 [Melospiza melodia maxima]